MSSCIGYSKTTTIHGTVQNNTNTRMPLLRFDFPCLCSRHIVFYIICNNNNKKVVEKDVAHKGYPHHYIEKLWDDMYLEGRWSLPINSNPYLALKPPPKHAAVPPGSDPQITGAVRWVHVIVDSVVSIEHAAL